MEKIVDSVDISVSGTQGSGKEEAGILQNVQDSLGEVDNLRNDALKHEGTVTQGKDEHDLDHEQHTYSHLESKLSDQVEVRRQDLAEMEAQWDAQRIVLEEEKIRLEEALHATQPEVYAKFKKLEEINRETECVIAEIKRREEEISELSAELHKQPNLAPRKTYIQRIIEITKNSQKQDADVDKILKDTRELQLESNSIQERLHRTYAVVDETVFREAKKDPVGRQAYRLLTSIHDSFEQIAERLLDTDRAGRERADIEAKLASMTSRTRSLDIEKLRADLDAVKKENDLLERQLLSSSSKDSS